MATTMTTHNLGAGEWSFDLLRTSVRFSVPHLVVGKVHGTFASVDGAITVTKDGAAAVSAEIDITSLSTGNVQRDIRVVKWASFFNTEQYPIAYFTSTAVRPSGDNYVLDGYFTLKGVTKQISLQLAFSGVASDSGGGEVATFHAEAVLDRRDFGIEFYLPLRIGDLLVGTNVTVTVVVQAVRTS
jgi:polyisoprenoid-binding protein YceI